jgi:hypothetical protein
MCTEAEFLDVIGTKVLKIFLSSFIIFSRAESGAPLRNSSDGQAARSRGDAVRSSHSGANKSGTVELAASTKSNLELTDRKCAGPSAVKTETELTRKEVVLKPR